MIDNLKKMLRVFRMKEKISKDEYSFFWNLVTRLPDKYDFLRNQANEEFILGKRPNPLSKNGSYNFLLNANLEKKYSDKSFPNYFILKDIKIWNKVKGSYEMIELDIFKGMLAGYKLPSKISDLDYNKMDVTQIKEKTFAEEDRHKVEQLLGEISENLKSILDIQSAFQIEIQGDIYYVIKDLGDGNYLSINEVGAICLMIHDPFMIEEIFINKNLFINAVESGDFNIQKFYESKFK
ncbi:hypothetical protein ACSBL2_09685 [Pedobacter sp. AW31-3R]|uniref:hypothetical protein n=1 Tax=Pedobacter sp. AW31-3R TaxID=3445781 RepID=UPI003FA06CD6